MKYIDAHSHWTDLRLSHDTLSLQKSFDECFSKGLNFFMQGGVDPDEWQRQLSLKRQYPETFGLCFGLHPYFVSDRSLDECEIALDQLAGILPEALALGETGLDFRPHIMKNSQELQIEMFENQIEMAKAFKKPLVMHIVQAHDKALQVLDWWGEGHVQGMVHAFGGSYETAKKYVDRGFLISVGGAVTYEKNQKLRDCIQKLGLEYFLVESDSPDQAPNNWKGLNHSLSVFQVAEVIAQIKNTSVFDVLESSTSNFKRVFWKSEV